MYTTIQNMFNAKIKIIMTNFGVLFEVLLCLIIYNGCYYNLILIPWFIIELINIPNNRVRYGFNLILFFFTRNIHVVFSK